MSRVYGDAVEIPDENPFLKPQPKAAIVNAQPIAVPQAPGTPIQSPRVKQAVHSGPTSPDPQQSVPMMAETPVQVQPQQPMFPMQPVKRAGCCGKFMGCFRGCVSSFSDSRSKTMSLLNFCIVAALAFFIYSCVLLDENTQAGDTCDASTCSGTPRLGCFVMKLAGEKLPCSDLCTTSAVASLAPFRFTLPDTRIFGSGNQAFITCPFPKINSDVHITLTFLNVIIGVLCVYSQITLKKKVFTVSNLLMICGGITYFYCMIVDAAAMEKGRLACKSGFQPYLVEQKAAAELECSSDMFVAVVLLDFFFCPLMVCHLMYIYSCSTDI